MGEIEHEFEARLERAKLEAMKELAYGASHEINNPLANISARAQTLLRDERDPERRRALEAIHQQALRAHEMISDLMLFARPPRLERQRIELAPLVEKVVQELRPEAERREVQIAVELHPATPPLDVDPVPLAVALKAVCQNAVDAIGRAGRIQVNVAPVAGLAGDEYGTPAVKLRISVTDTGPGINEAVRPHIFDPFFSGREAGRGLGFGLSRAWRIITDHGGQIGAESPAEGGARIVIELPVGAAVS